MRPAPVRVKRRRFQQHQHVKLRDRLPADHNRKRLAHRVVFLGEKKAPRDFEKLSDEQKAKVRACKSLEELYALAKEEGYELSETELEEISGGWELGPCFDAVCDTYRCGVIGH